jgi:phosphoribosylamine--glycine ligase
VIGPEAPLAAGLADQLRARGFDVFGPDKEPAQLEASKGFAKDLMTRFGVPTAAYGRFTKPADAKAFLATLAPPYVLKADGLAAGKGVVITSTLGEAEREAEAMLSGKFGDASAELVIEAFMPGEEASVFVLTDGTHRLTLPACQDHKRLLDGDEGPNTGGMGAYCPAPLMTEALMARVDEEIAAPMIDGLREAGHPYKGVLYIGLMITPEGPQVVEFNVRFGDPECQVLMASLEDDIVPVLLACATGGMPARDFAALMPGLGKSRPAASVVLATNGYPNAYEKGSLINGVKSAGEIDGVTVFHAGTSLNGDGAWTAQGGRVLSVTAVADSLPEAIRRAYEGVAAIDWPEGVHRRDIGWRAMGLRR